ncbi:phage structural protein [Fusobacterium necrophorum]|uniref:DUF3277 domain-containing protein n=2 Tax=Fusobacterium necrophorum TaxID=859 RepID=A0AAN3VXI8_9FUSO|nr:DUF3277 family protein [Fusobacterium necrophorum]AYV94643.1 DUF3277 family protein [Fusobacterium necrophorum subsp. funduliforme]EJU18804.1 hypothetical protein HMPREF1127_1139 [Fusobacterium necrophorum subsp. funduliforme Fnf 1007]KYL03347.1 hypothetical protein A2J06_09440 [Fusobacterium necrophorum subsp. funduliforme]KYM40859.1 hypothetical protein A2U03_03505 [Fusobacterium necrophorum subsp. funduliforme]KYM50788.1 hypothetical protein A2U04_00125 [Fusobacterium necrophorum subsp. 
MARNHYNYNSNKHDLVVNGTRVTDYGKDAKYTVAYESDFREVVTGADGDTITVEKNDRNALITVKILQSSPLNIIFSQLASSDKEFPVLLTDRNFNGDIGAFSSIAHFVKIADLNVETVAKEREWQIRAINLKPALDYIK